MPNDYRNSFRITDSTTTTRTSSGGFGSKTESCSQYMKNFLKQHKCISPAQIAKQQLEWSRDYSNRNYSYSLQDLLQCEHQDLAIRESLDFCRAQTSHMHLKPLISGMNGFWSILVLRDTELNIFDFTISVSVGDGYRFHPEAIKRDISSKYGTMIYATWRSMILDDLPSLERLLECIRERITFVAPSITCSKSSARLCQRVGIPVLNDVAFLFPSNYT